jgi:hypothetical protein
MINMLFKPFKIDKWFLLGLCAWITYHLGNQGFGYNGGGGGGGGNHPASSSSSKIIHGTKHVLHSSGSFIDNLCTQIGITVGTLVLILVIFGFVMLLIVAIALVISWLKARFEFIFIHNAAHDRTEIAAPWREYKSLGNSVFLFRVVLYLISFFTAALLLSVGFVGTLPWIKSCVNGGKFLFPSTTAIVSILVTLFLVILFSLFFSLIDFFLQEFVLVIMYKKGTKVLDAYKDFLEMLKKDTFLFVKYIFLKIGLSILVAAAAATLGILTCCIGFILMSLPYIGAVVLLPVYLTYRLFGMELLAAYAPEYSPFHVPVPAEGESVDVTVDNID